jgi:NAD(P)-dependent dehydrogenase (short-subunit alcohol dehydrogenase family)
MTTVQLTPTTIPIVSSIAEFSPSFGQTIEANILSITNTTNIFLPLIRKGKEKKIIVLSSGFADIEFTRTAEIPFHIPYSISKVAIGMLVAKYAVELKSEGIMTLSMAPGWVDTQERPCRCCFSIFEMLVARS